MVFNIIIILLTGVYVFQILRYFIGLFQLKHGTNRNYFTVSIIIPARNEAENIDKCLSSLTQQNYPQDSYEIIVVNDNSTDETEHIIKKYIAKFPCIKLLSLTEDNTALSPKKRAISAGIQISQNELIFTTDADCTAGPEWLQSMVKYFEHDVGLVSGIVTFDKIHEKTFFHKVQSLEFLSLVIAGAGSIGSDMPLIGNGANLAYRRSLFSEIDGFKGIDNLKSGDDDLLIQKVAKLTKWKIKCAIDKSAIILTKPISNITSFLNQRIRWASKGMHYHNRFFVIYLISVYLLYASFFIFLPFAMFHTDKLSILIYAYAIKIIFDFILLLKGTKMIGRRDLLKYFLFAEIFQVPYILIVGFAGLWGSFSWKGR